MQCPSCGHLNISDFPFCEECLTLLPKRPGSDLAFELDMNEDEPKKDVGKWPPFPWNPRKLEHKVFGRDKQIQTLLDSYGEVVSTWTGTLHLLVSEFGMGKNQVVKKLAERARIQEPQGRVVVIKCPEKGGVYILWDHIIRTLFEIPMSASPEDAGEILLREVQHYLPSEATEVAGLVADLVGFVVPNRVPEMQQPGADAVMSRSAGALYRLLQAVAREPMLLVVVQANRASAASLALVAALETSLKSLPAMLVLTGSPELTTILPGWERFPCTRLAPLSKSDSEKLSNYFFTGLSDIPSDIPQHVYERSKGSPWAIKSLIQYLFEAGAIVEQRGKYIIDEAVCWELEWPDDLEGVVLARLNMLSARDRIILGHAGVVGKVFWVGALVAIERRHIAIPEEIGSTGRDNLNWEINRALERLEAMRFLTRVDTKILGEETWAFRSKLHHDVAATIIPDATATRYNVTIEQWLRIHGDESTLFVLEELARHAEASGQNDKAALYCQRAARVAKEQHQSEKELRLLTKADTLISDDDAPARFSISFDLGFALEGAGQAQSALESFQEALHLAWRMRHRRHGAEALKALGQVETSRGGYTKAAKLFEAALRLFEDCEDHLGVAGVCLFLGKMFWLRGDHDAAEQSYIKSERLFSELGNREGVADVADAIASLKFDRGAFEDAEKAYRKAIQSKNAIDDVKGVASSLNNLGATWIEQGKGGKAISAWLEGLELADMIGHRELQATLAGNLGEAMLRSGQYDQAESYFDTALSWATVADAPRVLCDVHLNRAQLRLRRLDWDRAVEELESAELMANRLDLPRSYGHLASTLADLFAARSESSKGKARSKHLKKAGKHYSEAVDFYVAGACHFQAAKTREKLADIYDVSGEINAAEEQRRLARAVMK
jgi:tetratricopeptide (TPR) repeat protein